MHSDIIKAVGRLQIELRNAAGEVVDSRDIDNLVVTSGLGFIASRMKDATAAVMSHMAIGSGSTAAAAGNTALGTELGRVALTSTNVSGSVVTYVATFAAGTGTGTVSEAGLLNAASAGVMLARTVFSAINKGAGDSLTITWTVTLS